MIARHIIKSKPIDVGRGYSVEFTYDGLSILTCEWSPRVPWGRRGRQMLPAYRRARNLFLTKLAQQLRIDVAVVDL